MVNEADPLAVRIDGSSLYRHVHLHDHRGNQEIHVLTFWKIDISHDTDNQPRRARIHAGPQKGGKMATTQEILYFFNGLLIGIILGMGLLFGIAIAYAKSKKGGKMD